MAVDLVGAVVGWLVEVVGDAGIDLVRGSRDERELKKTIRKAIGVVVARADPASQVALRRGLELCFSSPRQIYEGGSPAAGGLRRAVVGKVDELRQWVNSDTGRLFYDDVSVSPEWVTEQVADAFITALRDYVARRGLAEMVHGLDTADIVARLDMLGLQISALTLPVPSAATRTLPPDAVGFIGRQAELQQVMRALDGSGSSCGMVEISAVNGMAGVGKTAFAVHVSHRLAGQFSGGQFFLRLHGHTPGHVPVEPTDALATLLLAVGVGPQQIPADLAARENLWRDRTAQRKALLVLDDAISSEQVRPLLPAASGSLVLVTSRHRLTAMPQALAVTLDVLSPGEGTELFVSLVGRHDVRADDGSVAQIATMCGHLPLALSLVAGQFKYHTAWSVNDLMSELRSPEEWLTRMTAEDDSVAASFGLSYRNLPPGHQQFFRRLGLHPGNDFDAYAAAALNGTSLSAASSVLNDLFGYHLVNELSRGRYRFHDLIKHYCRSLATTDGASERGAALERLLGYYIHTARAADGYLARRTPIGIPDAVSACPLDVPSLTSRDKAITWMETERLNLHLSADYAAQHDLPRQAMTIAVTTHSFLRTQGYWSQGLTLQHIALNSARRMGDPLTEACALNDLGVFQYLTSDLQKASESIGQGLALYRDLGSRLGEANALSELGVVQYVTGDFLVAITSLDRALALYRDLGDQLGEATALTSLGCAQCLTGEQREAVESLSRSLILHRGLGNQLGQATAGTNLGYVQYLTGDYQGALTSLVPALELHRALGNRLGEGNTLNYLGVAQQLIGDMQAGASTLKHPEACPAGAPWPRQPQRRSQRTR